ncbi:probable jasmonic acid carboxyl methyltransferase 2 [Argentina anserina]|uniref:probable jasmonic acid carboxyl methyltransferase 2 n=1 Tax=Argentina anserina TaxID=57926 RepID=UPI0021761E4E|nr:probable jasmonic acid carboxyl methyltransferase 2 [Potentilla anserina]
MEVAQVLHMNGGDSKSSYANHSLLQRAVISTVKPIVEASIEELCSNLFPECLKIADLGCSSGPNTLLVVSDIINNIQNTFRKLDRPPPSLQAFLNDLPRNDFNTVFRLLPGFYKKLNEEHENKGSYFIAAMPGSYYGRLFPDNSLHFVHSSYALMWISEVPKGLVTEGGEGLNKGNIYIAKTSTPAVFHEYFEQFKRDFTVFLRSRAQELVPGGSMVLTTMGSIKSNDPHCIWEFVGSKLYDMVLDGLIEEEKLDTFNLPYYAPTMDEVKEVIEAEGSFTLQNLEVFRNDWDSYIKQTNSSFDKKSRAAILSTDIRAVGEPILASHFGEETMDDLFRRFEEDVLDHMEKENCQFINLVISLTKKC